MAITQKSIDSDITANNWAFKAAADTAVTTIHLCNITNADATVNIYLVPNDGSTSGPTENNKLYNGLTLKATDTYVIDNSGYGIKNGSSV